MLPFSAHERERDLDLFLLVDIHLGTRGKNSSKNVAHAIAQLDITPRFAGLTFQRISLPVHFRKDVVDARKILPCRFEA